MRQMSQKHRGSSVHVQGREGVRLECESQRGWEYGPELGSWRPESPSLKWAQRDLVSLALATPFSNLACHEAHVFLFLFFLSSSFSCFPPFLSIISFLHFPFSPLPILLFLLHPIHLLSFLRYMSTIMPRKDTEVCLLCVSPSFSFIDTYLNLSFIVS